jgi:orotate phosphoribosyltransferase
MGIEDEEQHMRDRIEVLAHLRAYSMKISLPGDEFPLASGGRSRLYIDAKKTSLHPKMHRPIARLLRREIAKIGSPETLGGVVLGGAHLASIAASYANVRDESTLGVALVRPKEKDHGTRHRVECPWRPRYGETCVVVEDVLSTGKTALSAIAALHDELYRVIGVVALVDRRPLTDQTDVFGPLPLRAVFTLPALDVPSDVARIV